MHSSLAMRVSMPLEPAGNCKVCLHSCALLLSQIKDDLVDAASAKAAAEAAQRGNMLMNALWSIVGGAKQVRRRTQQP